jgi:hypothetical protein
MNRTDWITHLERLGNPSGEAVPMLPPDRTLLAGTRGEQRLWRLCAGETAPDADPAAVIGSVLGDRRGSLLAPDAFLAIEVWAECELAAVHALHRLARELRAALDPLGADGKRVTGAELRAVVTAALALVGAILIDLLD